MKWHAADRLHERTVFPFLAIVAQRFHELGDDSSANQILSRLKQLKLHDANELLWLADLHRRMGDSATADTIELKLLRLRRLHVERIPDAIARLRVLSGTEVAFREGEAFEGVFATRK